MSHYVIGDVHGCYDALMKLLGKINLTSEDKVYFVGDWIDRAPTKEQQIDLLRWYENNVNCGKNFYSTVGNHDIDAMELCYIFRDDVETIKTFRERVESSPTYYMLTINEQKVIVTHSWLCTEDGENAIPSISSIYRDFSIWDRRYSLSDNPDDYKVVHGHTIVASKHCRINRRVAIPNKICYIGENNIDIDCGCFMGLQSGGNLAALRLEDCQEFYSYDISNYRERIEYICDLNGMSTYRPYQIMAAFSHYGLDIFNIEDGWIKEQKEEMLKDSNLNIRHLQCAISIELMNHKIDGEDIILWR